MTRTKRSERRGETGFGTFARKVAGRIRGIVRWQQRLHAWDEWRFDRRLGVDTRGVFEPVCLTVAAGDAHEGHPYVGTQPRLARWWLSELPRDAPSYTFVDMGSGKGRVLLIAAEAGFARSLGVEFAEELHATAVTNARAAARQGLLIEPTLGDAGSFTLPSGPLIVHFSNPFTEAVMERVIENLRAAYRTEPRPLVLVYQQMKSEPAAHRTANLELLQRVPYLTARVIAPPGGRIARRLLEPFQVTVFESVEAAAAGAETS